VKLPFEYKSDFKEVKKDFRDSEGRVKIQPRNVQTGQTIKDLYKFPKAMTDEYDRY
jgi:hypothetical protein